MSDPIDQQTFAKKIGETFTVTHLGHEHTLTLVACEAEDIGKDAPEAGEARKRHPFTLMLRGEPGMEARSDVYTLAGPGMEAIEGVLVTRVEGRAKATAEAGTPDDGTPYYEICFA
ncbi:DUF6916 family protein [Ferruginivarius sediminum]|uniref:DUF6916 domain-containing protein n=1 Tax=Ferruginivarius sediminum TaxID=2661937 RepID=A0A369TCL3_9PROT|nr:hypothetical protein [Ferruginivarius sediminum]RDD63073.1 hypothetical protein DRB17_04690 [Ferruginivarius sediminum]